MALTLADLVVVNALEQRYDRAVAERDAWRLMARAAMDALATYAHAPDRAEQIDRELRKEREGYMTVEIGRVQENQYAK